MTDEIVFDDRHIYPLSQEKQHSFSGGPGNCRCEPSVAYTEDVSVESFPFSIRKRVIVHNKLGRKHAVCSAKARR